MSRGIELLLPGVIFRFIDAEYIGLRQSSPPIFIDDFDLQGEMRQPDLKEKPVLKWRALLAPFNWSNVR